MLTNALRDLQSLRVSLCVPDTLLRGQHHWDVLRELWEIYGDARVGFEKRISDEEGYVWEIRESVAGEQYHMRRNCLTLQRITLSDPYGLLGLSLVNPHDGRVILTEGVSDFFTVKLLHPTLNVLGVTTLGANRKATQLLLNLFDYFLYCADNDSGSSVNTGLTTSLRLKQVCMEYSKKFSIFVPSQGKDVTELFMSGLKRQKIYAR